MKENAEGAYKTKHAEAARLNYTTTTHELLFRILFEKRPSPYAGDRQSDTTEAAGHTRTHGNNLRNPTGGRPPKPHKARLGGRTRMGTPKRAKGEGQPPPGAKKKLHWPKEWEGKGER